MSTSSSGGRGRAAASTSSLLRSRLGPRESGLRASGCSWEGELFFDPVPGWVVIATRSMRTAVSAACPRPWDRASPTPDLGVRPVYLLPGPGEY